MMNGHTLIRCMPMLAVCALMVACAQTPSQGMDASLPASHGRETNDQDSARVHTELGAEYLRLHQLDVALEEFNTAIQRSSSYALAYNGLGLVYAALGEKGKAEAAFQRAIQLQPNSSESHNNYGRFLCDQGHYDASIQQFLLALKNPLYKTPQIAYHNAGVCAALNQQPAQAERYFLQALTIDPAAHASAYQLAQLEFARGDGVNALNHLQYALNSAPTPEALALAVRISRALELRDQAREYRIQLYKLFPNTKEAKQLGTVE